VQLAASGRREKGRNCRINQRPRAGVQGRSASGGSNNRRRLLPRESAFLEHLSHSSIGPRSRGCPARLEGFIRRGEGRGEGGRSAALEKRPRSNERNGTLEISRNPRAPSTCGHLHKFDLLRPKTRPPGLEPQTRHQLTAIRGHGDPEGGGMGEGRKREILRRASCR